MVSTLLEWHATPWRVALQHIQTFHIEETRYEVAWHPKARTRQAMPYAAVL
jgi:hypothetical protein